MWNRTGISVACTRRVRHSFAVLLPSQCSLDCILQSAVSPIVQEFAVSPGGEARRSGCSYRVLSALSERLCLLSSLLRVCASRPVEWGLSALIPLNCLWPLASRSQLRPSSSMLRNQLCAQIQTEGFLLSSEGVTGLY